VPAETEAGAQESSRRGGCEARLMRIHDRSSASLDHKRRAVGQGVSYVCNGWKPDVRRHFGSGDQSPNRISAEGGSSNVPTRTNAPGSWKASAISGCCDLT
jgi:hypothetical protein